MGPRQFVALVALGASLAISRPAHTQQSPPPAGDELRTLHAAFDFVRGRNARDYVISTPNGIDESKYVKVGGIEQWVTIRGEDRANPVVLVLHGGPGDATNPWGYAGFRTWLRTYTVVQWDQRGTGRTLGRNGPASAATLSIDRLVQDGVELADTLRTQLRKDKIILVGHSFGSMLGVLMAKARPALFQAFVGTGQVGDQPRNYHVAFEALVTKARATGDARAVRELEEIGPPPYKDGRGYQVQRRWSNLFEGADAFIASMVGFALSAPGYTARDVNDWFNGQMLSAERLVPQSSALPASALTGRFDVPVFVIQGVEDFTTPTSLAKAFVDGVTAPRKAFVTIPGGHFAVFMNPSEFVNQLTELLAQPVASPAPWPGQRRAAIALTYDDAAGSQLEVAIPQLDAAGLKGTFFLMGRQIGERVPGWRSAAAKGHQLGNHTVNHPCAKGTYDMPAQYTSEAYTVDVLLTEVTSMNGWLRAMDDQPAHAFATPCEQNLAGGQDYLAPLQKAAGVSYIRDHRTMPPSVRYTSFVDRSGAEMIKWVEEVAGAGAAGVIVFHGVGGDYLSVSADAHQQLVTYLKAHDREIWTATFSEVMDAATRVR